MRGRLTGRNIAVVAGLAASYDLRVVNHDRWHPQIYAVAILANRCCLDMRQVFSGRIGSVVAIATVAGDIRMIEGRGRPGDRRMAVVAVVTAVKMRWVLACRSITVMTGPAATKNLRVVDPVGRLKRD